MVNYRTAIKMKGRKGIPNVDLALRMLLNMNKGLKSCAIERIAADWPTNSRYG